MIKCKVCGQKFKAITNTHLKKHNTSMKEYMEKVSSNIFSRNQKIYYKNHIPWNKGRTNLPSSWNKNSCKVNHSFFKEESSDMYYILGLWFADGYLYLNRGKNKVTALSLHSRDRILLEIIADKLEFRKKLHEYKDGRYPESKQTVLAIYSEEIYDDLVSFGCTPRKSLTLQFPEIPAQYEKDFIRGFLDGDGSIMISKRYLQVAFCSGSKEFLHQLSQKIKYKLEIESSKVYENKESNACFIRYSSHRDKAKKLLEWIYDTNSLYLERKYTIFRNYSSPK